MEVATEAKSGVVRPLLPLLPRHLAALLFPAISLTRLSGPSTDALRRRRRLHSPSPVAVATPSSTSRPGTVPRLIRGDNMGGRARKGSLYFLSRSGSGVAGFRQPGGGSGSAGYLWMPPLYLRIARTQTQGRIWERVEITAPFFADLTPRAPRAPFSCLPFENHSATDFCRVKPRERATAAAAAARTARRTSI